MRKVLIVSLAASLLALVGTVATAEDTAWKDREAEVKRLLPRIEELLRLRSDRALRLSENRIPPADRLSASDPRCRRGGLQPAVFMLPGWCPDRSDERSPSRISGDAIERPR